MHTEHEFRDPHRLIVFDTTLRDGEQSPGVSLGTPAKLDIAAALDRLGVDVIEAGFPAASTGEADAVAAVAAKVLRASVCALARCHEADIRTAAAALRPAARPRLHVFIATSPLHMRHKLKLSAGAVMARARQGIKLALEYCPDVEFSAEDATRSELTFLLDVVAMADELGVRTINIPDTVGYSTPVDYAELIGRVCAATRAAVSVHCHDDLGLAAANSLAGVSAGARQVECTINGLGERAGNAALEEVVMAIRTRPDRYPLSTGINTQQLCGASALIARLSGIGVPPNKAVVGANAFAHESGIHQHGVLGRASTYEVMRAEDVGARTRIVLGKHSGRHAFQSWMADRGVSLAGSELERAFLAFKSRADSGASTVEADIVALAQPASSWRAVAVSEAGSGPLTTATVSFEDSRGRTFEGVGSGELPHAVANAVAQALGHAIALVSCRTEFPSQGDGAVALARVECRYDGRTVSGEAFAPSEGEAIAHAILGVVPASGSGRLELAP